MMEFRNAIRLPDGGINMEINHPKFGWLPFTASQNDPELSGREMFELANELPDLPEQAPPQPTGVEVDIERDRRIIHNFRFGGVAYDFDAVSKSRITGMGTLAGFAVAAGSQAGDLRWANPSVDFVWIASDNSFVSMDAWTCFAFAQAAARHESAHIFAARALKDLPSVPVDYTDDAYWP